MAGLVETAWVTDTPRLDSVPEVLTWRSRAGAVDHAVRSHVDVLVGAFQRILAGPSGSPDISRLRAITRVLPPRLVRRMVAAPESCRRLLYGKDPSVEFFIGSALAERKRLSALEVVPDEGVWTALGDCWFPASAASALRAPALSNGVVVDLASPHAARFLQAYAHSSPSPGSVDTRAVVAKLEGALAVVAATSPEAARFFSSVVQVVIPWNDPGAARRRSSVSDTRWVGAVACANVLAVDDLDLVDMLIHESVHSFLAMIEEHEPMISDLGAVRGMRVPSPWTGTPLHPRNFLHACLVWFALSQFWGAACNGGVVDEGRARRLMDQAGAGFHSPVMPQALAQVTPYLSSGARRVIPSFLDGVRAGAYRGRSTGLTAG